MEDQIIEGPIGPHPVSQFEIVFFRPAYQEFLAWLLVSATFLHQIICSSCCPFLHMTEPHAKALKDAMSIISQTLEVCHLAVISHVCLHEFDFRDIIAAEGL